MKRSYDIVLLDWDGNLAKTLDIWLDAFRQVLTARKLNPTDQEIAACFGASLERFANLGIQDVEAALDEAGVIAKRAIPDVELYPDALELLEYLKDHGKKTGLLTTSPHENIRHLLEKYDMVRLFDVIIAADDVTHHKPHPESIEKAIAYFGGEKDQAIMIGDSDKDLGAAKNAGIDSVLFYPPEHKKFYDLVKLKKLDPTYVIGSFREVESIV